MVLDVAKDSLPNIVGIMTGHEEITQVSTQLAFKSSGVAAGPVAAVVDQMPSEGEGGRNQQ